MDFSPKQIVVNDIAATTGGNLTINTGTFTILSGVAADTFTVYRITGTQTLASDLDIVASGTLLKNLYVEIYHEAALTLSGNDYTIFGVTVPAEFASAKFKAECLYDGSAWKVIVIPSMDGTGLIAAKLLATDSVTTVKIVDLNVTTAKINDLAVTTAKIAAANVTTAKITDLNVTTGKIADLGVTTGKIADLGVTTAKINDLGVTTGKIADLGVTAAKIADATVTPTKMSANANTYTRDLVLSFQLAAEVGVLNYTINEACSIVDITTGVLAPPTGDDITLIFKNNGGTELTDSQTDITTAHVLGNQISVTPSANNTFAAGDTFTIEGTKTTKTSGKVNVAIRILKA